MKIYENLNDENCTGHSSFRVLHLNMSYGEIKGVVLLPGKLQVAVGGFNSIWCYILLLFAIYQASFGPVKSVFVSICAGLKKYTPPVQDPDKVTLLLLAFL